MHSLLCCKIVKCSWQSKEATYFKPWMSSTVGSVAVATSDTLGNTSDAVNDHISKPDKEHVRRASLPCIWDSSIWSSVRYTCENSWYCSDSTCHTLNSGNSYLSHRRGKPRRGRSGTGLCLDRRTDGKWNRSKSQTWCHIPYNVTRHLAVYHTDCTWFVEPSSSLTHEFSQLHRGKSDKGISCYNMEPEKNISSHNAHSPPCFSFVDLHHVYVVMGSMPPRLFPAVINCMHESWTRCCLATMRVTKYEVNIAADWPRTRQIYSHLDRKSLVNKGFVLWRTLISWETQRVVRAGKIARHCPLG